MTATSSPSTTEHKRPNYVMIWLYLFVLTVAEVALAFELPLSRNLKLLLLLFLAVWKALLVALLELTKPRITQLVLLTAAAGFYVGARDRVDLLLLANTLIGTALVAGGTNAWNQIRERDVDARM